MSRPTPTATPGQVKRLADFATITEALDYAAQGWSGLNFYGGKGELTEILTYADLRAQATGLARRMLAAGMKPGDRVALLAESDGDFVRAFFGSLYAGLVPAPMPLPTAFGGRDGYVASLRRMIESADAAAVFGPAVLRDWIAEATTGLELVCAGTIADMDEVEPAPEAALPQVGAGQLAYLQFSSGSTRFPIGVAVTQRAFMANAHHMSKDGLNVGVDDRCASWLPFYHDMGLVGFLLMPMACQMSVDILPTREFARRPLLWLQIMSRNRATIAFSPSFGYELCTRRMKPGAAADIDLSAWRRAGIGGDMIRPHVLHRFAAIFEPCGFAASAFTPCYGMAEATLALSFTPEGQGVREDAVDRHVLEREHRAVAVDPANENARRFVVCGRSLPGHTIELRGDAGETLSDREVGRIFVSGPSLMRGYFAAPEETARVLTDDGWLDTGDLGYVVDGQLVITGRAKDLIIVNGRNIWPQDLEWAAETEMPELRSGDVAVVSVDNDETDEVVVLVQCRLTEPGARDTLALSLTRFFRGRLGLETRVVLVPPHGLPQTSSGKLSRSRARAMYLDGMFAPRMSSVAAE